MNILFLDDMEARTKKFKSFVPSARCTETAVGMIGLINSSDEPIDYIFLDHDLGGQTFVDSSESNTGMEVVRWMEANQEDLPEIEVVVVHSHNPVAAQNMVLKLQDMNINSEAIPFGDLNLESFSDAIHGD